MNLRFLGTYGGQTRDTGLTSFLVDECLALDAGSLTQMLSLEEQSRITDILISHTHLDHTLSLPFLADNLYGEIDHALRVHGTPETIDALRNHLFNEVIWPDFTALPSRENPIVKLMPYAPETPFQIGDLRVTAIPVNHVVPCHGFLLEGADGAMIYTADTATTDRIWEIANRVENLRAVIVDCSFPNDMEELAVVSGHMTPRMLARDLEKLTVDCEVLVYHLKPNFEQTLRRQLAALGDSRLVIDRLEHRQLDFLGRRATV